MTTQAHPAAGTPTITTNDFNYNPSVVLNGSSYMGGQMTNTPPIGTAISFAVAKGVGTGAIGGILTINGQNGNILANNLGGYGTDANGFANYPATPAAVPNTPYVIGADYTNFSVYNSFVRLNGLASAGGTNYTLSYPTYDGNFGIGVRNDRFNGNVAEVVYYISNNTITETQKNRIESYLALKYGITLDNTSGGGNYSLTNNTNVWNASINPGYHNKVIAIARDDSSALLQKQSHTQDDSLRVFLGTLSSSNQLNGTTINNNRSALAIGNDGGAPQWSPSVSKPATIASRLVRTFKVTNTNFTNSFSIEIKCDSIGGLYSLSNLRFLVSSSPDFTAATEYMAPDVSFAFGSIIVNGISNSVIPAGTTRYVTVGLSLIILPINLLQFDANAVNNKQVNLNWQTASETHGEYYTIQKSVDGKKWNDVEKVKVAANPSGTQSYQSVDYQPYKGVSYYRLYQPGTNGQQRYSTIRSVHIDNATLLNIYPNPTSGNVTIEGAAAELKHVRLYNTVGQDVTDQARIVSNNGTKLILDLSRLANGIITIKSVTTATKIFKQ